MNDGIMQSQQFTRVQTYTGILRTTGVEPAMIQNVLAASTYTEPSGFYYATGAIIALNDDGEFINCDPSAEDSQAVAVGFIYDDHLLVSDNVGTGVVGQYTKAIFGSFCVDASALYATAADRSDVADAMESLGATYDATTNTYRKF